MPLGSLDIARRLDQTISDLNAQYSGSARFEGELFIPSPPALARLHERVRQLDEEVQSHPQLTAFWKQHFGQILPSIDWRLQSDTRLPYAYIARLSSFVYQSMQEGRPREERRELLGEKLVPLDAFLDAVVAHVANCGPQRREQFLAAVDTLTANLGHALDHFGDDEECQKLLQAARNQIATLHSSITALPLPEEPLPEPSFGEILEKSLGVNEAYVLSWYQEDFEQCRDHLEEMARRLDASVSTQELLDRELPAPTSPEEMFALMRDYLQVARTHALEYITLPEGEYCRVGPVPEQHRLDCPWGLYSGGDAQRGQLTGTVCLNQYNYQAITRGWLMLMAAHEGYPGHHAHYVKTASQKLPHTFRSGLPLTRAMGEGIAHRSERLMQHIFENPAYPVFVAYRRLHCALRVKAEVELNVNQRPAAEIIDLYQKIMGFNEHSARVQVQAHLMYPADGVSYYTGMRVLEQLQAEGNYPEPAFTETIFSHGSVSLDTIANIVALPQEAQRQLGQFTQES